MALNAKLLHILPYSAVAGRMAAISGEAFWDAIKSNLTKLSDVAGDGPAGYRPVAPVIEDAGLAAKAAALLPAEPWMRVPGVFGPRLFLPRRGPRAGPVSPLAACVNRA